MDKKMSGLPKIFRNSNCPFPQHGDLTVIHPTTPRGLGVL